MILRVLAGLTGFIIVSGTLISAARTVVVPRAEHTLITRALFTFTRLIFRTVAVKVRRVEVRERVLSRYAPVTLLALPAVWSAIIIFGAGLVYWAVGLQPAEDAFIFSGSAFTTLGTATSDNFYYLMMAAAQAVLGLEIIALMISFLPSIYSAFSRREELVTRLEALAGTPSDAEIAILRSYEIGLLPKMNGLWKDWSNWFAGIEESHTTFNFLGFFRSPTPDRSWVTAATTILDTAAIRLTAIDSPPDPWARLMIRTGYLAIRRIADEFNVEYDEDPTPTDPISIERDDFLATLNRLAASGVPIVEDREQAWRDFAGWRVNYDSACLGLAQELLSPPGRWCNPNIGR